MILETQEFEILLTADGKSRKIAKIKFGSKGDIYVFFSKFIPSHGVMSMLTLKAGTNGGQFNLAEPGHGKVTSHIVKYTHHPDGEAHFSQDGKIFTRIRKKSSPLSDMSIHFFTLQFQGFGSFPEYKPNPKVPHFNIRYEGNKCVKILGRWFYKAACIPANSTQDPGLPMVIQSKTGTQVGGAYSPPPNSPFYDHFLFIEPKEIELMDPNCEPTLIFLGGFDKPAEPYNPSGDISYLALLYPCSDLKTLTEKVGSLDILKS